MKTYDLSSHRNEFLSASRVNTPNCHCEERFCDEAISLLILASKKLDCFVAKTAPRNDNSKVNAEIAHERNRESSSNPGLWLSIQHQRPRAVFRQAFPIELIGAIPHIEVPAFLVEKRSIAM